MTRTQRQIEESRLGAACIQVRDDMDRPCIGAVVSVEQESHAFRFGCIVPNLQAQSQQDRERYCERLNEVFNCLVSRDNAVVTEPGTLRVDVAEPVQLGVLRRRLEQLSASGARLSIHIWGSAVGMTEALASNQSERQAGNRMAALYTLCFAHPVTAGIYWNGCVDGDLDVRGGGLLRADLAPKYVHKVLQKLIGTIWHTRSLGQTDADGLFRFRGFHGDYRVVVNVGEPNVHVSTISLHRSSSVSVFGIGGSND